MLCLSLTFSLVSHAYSRTAAHSRSLTVSSSLTLGLRTRTPHSSATIADSKIIVAFLTVLEKFADVVIGWLPLYGELKLALFIYMWYHKTKGTKC
ncbi:hypothetical protein P8452_42318 [Trifolium repens]|nr:hypothetical protein P8452_42318 [Trifolium repens]